VILEKIYRIGSKRLIYSVFTKDKLDEKGQARGTKLDVTL